MKVKRAQKYGFCIGVRQADERVRAFAAAGRRGRILGQVVHNERVVEDLTRLGVATVERLDQVDSGAVVFSAHGVPPSFHRTARERGLEILDTTCPFVYAVHEEAARARRGGWHLVFIGDPHHREVIGYTHDLDPAVYDVVSTVAAAETLDYARHPRIKIFYQTTLNAEQYEEVARTVESRAREARRADTICYATKENQDAARALAADPEVDAMVVVGGRHSANTRHLWEICSELKPSLLLHALDELRPGWFAGCSTVGLTAGASTPDVMIDEVERVLLALGERPGAARAERAEAAAGGER
ncbi:MAG TPA: 4-hydroxy-3-methylbut-2-enyl diphosphate reductase [Thermoanaerobaculia bacterium]|nr:4-hydroxy-3-methylbut-2-enyl diphosphate reductase [Thermoanaerobaculia bacterium]